MTSSALSTIRLPLSMSLAMFSHRLSPMSMKSCLAPIARAPCSVRPFGTFRQGILPNRMLQELKRQPSRVFQLGFFRNGSRSLMTDRQVIQDSPPLSWKRLATIAAGVAGATVVTNAVLNRDTRDALSPGEKSLLNETFTYTGTGLLMTALAARAMFQSGVAFRVMTANPWVVLGVGLAGSIGTMMGTYFTPPEHKLQKHAFWLAFNMCQAATLSPLFFLSPAILSRAALYTVGAVGAIAYVGATATNDKYLYLGGPLLAGVTVVALSSLAPMVLPMGIRGLAISEAVSLYGGLAVFSGFVLYDTQKILQHARMAEHGQMKADPINESISLELDMINIFIRLVQLLGMQGNNRKQR